MKFAVSWFCLLHLALVGAGLFSRHDLHSSVSGRRNQTPHSTGSLSQGRQRSLFARRGHYERQRIHVPKPKEVPVTPNGLPPPTKSAPKAVQSTCSELTQSCLPQSGCCDPRASCHCRFFNAICFCRLYKNKT
uniref:agouti-signaling protein-like n=1 Tax=Scatophagus argus TaxID=75038 RepID=UPI001ED854B0|nr:agouti-signaling protein-like [Scatophagus argus]